MSLLLSGETGNALIKRIRRNKIIAGDRIEIVSEDEDGTFLQTKLQLFVAEFEGTLFAPRTADVSDQLKNEADPNVHYYIPPADFNKITKPAGAILGGFFGIGYGHPVSMKVKADGVLVRFGGLTTIVVGDLSEPTILAADDGQIVRRSLVYEFTSEGIPPNYGNDQVDLFVWGVMP